MKTVKFLSLTLIVACLLSSCGNNGKSNTNSSTPPKEVQQDYSAVNHDEESANQSEQASEPDKKPVTDTKKWDDILVSYEKYIDQYIKLYKKAQAGDVSAITEYASMAEKATELAEKLQDAGDELTATQAAKFTKLQTKLANALQ